MTSLRARAEKLYVDLYSYKHPKQDEGMIRAFEAALLEIRNQALEECALTLDHIAEDPSWYTGQDRIDAIRALKLGETK